MNALYIVQNCWFCNENSTVWFASKNSWICNHCKQYNGFNEEGDYNREIKAMHQFKDSGKKKAHSFHEQSNSNGLCDHCNYYQQLKIEKLASFKPKNEENYDEEIKSYKEYLEKIYEICNQCESKVKFELTKQNGILKQYFLNLGNFEFFYKRKNSPVNNSKEQLNIKQTVNVQKRTANFMPNIDLVLLKATCFLLIFILAGLILTYNRYSELNEFSPNSTTVQLHKILNENFILKSKNFMFNMLKSNNIFNSKLKVFKYFNSKLPLFLQLILILSCLTVLNSKKRFNIGYFSNILILLIDLILVVKNFSLYFNINSGYINVGSIVLFLIPIIQLIIVYKLIYFIFSLCFSKSKTQVSEEKKISLLKSELHRSNIQKTENIRLNYDTVTPKSYTLMKFIESSNPGLSSSNSNLNKFGNSNLNKNKLSMSTNSCFMHPSRFVASVNNLTFNRKEKKPNFKNSIDDSMDRLSNNSELDESDESSIISGLTNLYLNKRENQAKSNLCIFETENKSLFNNSAPNGSSSYSFYQETPNRSFFNHNLNC